MLGALAALRSVEHNPLLDRLIGGRVWIGLLAFALIGIVTLQLGLLKLNAGIGRTLAQETSLRRENAELSIENSERAAGDRVEASAARLGMELVPIGGVRQLTPYRGEIARAASALSAPLHTSSSSEAPAGTSEASSSSSEQPASEATSTQQADEAPATTTTAAGESGAAQTNGGEASSGASTPSQSTGASSATSPAPTGTAGSGSVGEATPAGGTQAGPTG